MKPTRWMKRAIVALYAGLVLTLAAATWMEHLQGSAVVQDRVYGSSWFFAAWALLAVGVTAVAVRYWWWKRGAVGGLHLSFVLILAGAALTVLTGRRGYVHLQPGEPVNRDPWGIALTYMGYAWWGVSAVGLLLASRSRFRCR